MPFLGGLTRAQQFRSAVDLSVSWNRFTNHFTNGFAIRVNDVKIKHKTDAVARV